MDLLSKRIVEQIREKVQARTGDDIARDAAKGVMSRETEQAISDSQNTMRSMQDAMLDVVAKTISDRTPVEPDPFADIELGDEPEVLDEPTKDEPLDLGDGIMSPPSMQEEEELEIIADPITDDSTINEPIADGVQPEDGKVGTLEIVNASRADYAPTADMPNISLDFNSFKGAKGTEVIIPDNASPEVREAAEKFNQMVVDFAAKHGYENYKNRGVKTTSENKRGVSNTIHVEPFFTQDAKIEAIINDNMDEFAQIYKQAFGGVTGRMVLPHGVVNSKGVQDRGAVSKTFGDEYSFGESIISRLLGD
ncbi:hypothetical protein CRP2_gp48 [Roseobacter phage CRP-2]|nr:hypothetical protein CRP2_gp48 [Roseobacter phage CRP-2]